jgi:hypothetical protein
MFGLMKPISLKLLTAFGVLLTALATSCTPTPGDGGRASITGHVEEEARLVLTNGNSAQGDPYPARDHNVFLIYGDNVGPDDQVETNHEGNFVFPWLRPGDYTVYVYSEDTLGTNPPQDLVVLQQVSIESATETVVLDTLRVYKEL